MNQGICKDCVNYSPYENVLAEGLVPSETIKKAEVEHVKDLGPGYCSHWKMDTFAESSCQDFKAKA